MSNILDQLRERSRPTIEARDNALAPEMVVEPSESNGAAPRATPAKLPKNLNAELKKLPTVADRRQIRLEEKIDQELERLCKQQPRGKRITIETFLEAAHIVLQQHPQVLSQVMDEAAQRYAQRKRAGQLRRIQSQLDGEI